MSPNHILGVLEYLGQIICSVSYDNHPITAEKLPWDNIICLHVLPNWIVVCGFEDIILTLSYLEEISRIILCDGVSLAIYMFEPAIISKVLLAV